MSLGQKSAFKEHSSRAELQMGLFTNMFGARLTRVAVVIVHRQERSQAQSYHESNNEKTS